MDAERWRAIKYVFDAALQQPAAGLGDFLDQACGNDTDLRAEVNRLLIEHLKVGDFLETPLPPQDLAGRVSWTEDAATDRSFLSTARFEVRRRLGAGGFGEVYEVFDRTHNTLVAAKYLRTFQPEQLYRLKAEFRALTDIRHPNLINVYELFSGSDPPFFTMELLTGRDLGQCLDGAVGRLREAGSFERFREYFVQLSKGVVALHEADLLHRDIKPSNIFVTDGGRIVLLDFGLVKHVGRPGAAQTLALAGTPHYLAPEQLEGKQPTEAADWYSVGVLLYKALTGREPFDGSVLDVLSRKTREDPLCPSAVASAVTPDLDSLCSRLLSRDPLMRPSGYEVLRVLQGSTPGDTHATASRRRSGRIFVSREPFLMSLQRAFEESLRGATICVHLRGSSGVGKTAVAARFLDRIQDQHSRCVVLSGRCYESEAAPHKGLDEFVDHLARFLKGLDSQQLQSVLPRYFILLARLFPVLQELPAEHRLVPNIPDLHEQRLRAFGALRECLARIAERSQLILWFDDLQWADADTVRVLNEMVQCIDPFPCMILLSYRDNDLKTNPVLAALDFSERRATGIVVTSLDIEALDYEDARTLATVLLEQAAAPVDKSFVASTIARESKGNPYFVTELVRYVASLGDRTDLSVGAFGIGHVIKRRVSLLPEAAKLLLELIAVAGRPVRADVCQAAARLDQRYFEVRSILLREHLLRPHTSAETEQLDVYHDQIREAITGYLSREATIVYHALLANTLEDQGCADYEWLAVHFEGAGNNPKAMRYTTLAAAAAVEGLAFDRAARLYQRLLDFEGDDTPTRQRVLEELGNALSNAGRGNDAAHAFLLASERRESSRALDLRRRACEQYLRSGHLDEGMALCKSLLRDVGIAYPEHHWAVLASLFWSRVRLKLAMLRVPHDAAGPSAEGNLRLDICWTVTVGMSMFDVLRGADFQARFTLLALRTGEPSRVALGLAAELAGAAIGGRRSQKKTESLFDNAMYFAKKAGNHHALGFTTSMRGVVSWFTGDWNDCYERNIAAAAIYRDKCSGVAWELTTANGFALSSLVFLGRWREHALTLPGLVLQAKERGDRYGAASLPLLAYAYVDALVDDQPADARAAIEHDLSGWRDDEFHLQHCDALIGQIEIALYEGDPAGAQGILEREWPRLKRSHLLEIQFYRILMTALRARIALALAVSRRGSEQTGRLLQSARHGVGSLVKSKAPWGLALAQLLSAGVASCEGRTNEAMRSLQAAGRMFEAARMQHYDAIVRLRMSQMQPGRAETDGDANPWIREQRIANCARIADMLAPGTWLA